MKFFIGFILLLIVVSGCTTKSESQAQAQAAFAAGQQQAFAQLQQKKSNTVKFIGSVKNQIIPWTENLTLAQAIVAAEYQAIADPRTILIIRNGQTIPVTPKQLFRGEDFPLQAGDVVEIR